MPQAGVLGAWAACLPTPAQLTNGIYFDPACRELLKATAMEDSLDVLPLRAAFEKTVAPLLASRSDLWSAEVRRCKVLCEQALRGIAVLCVNARSTYWGLIHDGVFCAGMR